MLEKPKEETVVNASEAVDSFRLADYRGWVVKSYLNEKFLLALGRFLTEEMTPEKAFKSARHSRVFQLPYDRRVIFVKCYSVTGIKAALQTLLYGNRAQKAWRIGRVMLERGLETPLPIFYIHRKLGWVSSEHIVGTVGVPGAVSLKEYVDSHFQTGKNGTAAKRRFIEKLAAFIGRLHRGGIYHGDLTANNILVESEDGGGGSRFQLIDIDSVRATRRISTRRRVKNLDELGRNFLDLNVIGMLDRARFIRHYLSVYALEKRNFRPFLEAVAERTDYRLRRHGQRFRKRANP